MEATGLILVAAGQGLRFGADRPKPLVELGDRPLVARSMQAFRAIADRAVLVVPAGREAEFSAAVSGVGLPFKVVAGGERRQDSVAAGLEALDAEIAWVLVHDAARPLVDGATVRAVLEATRAHGAAIPVAPVHSTVKEIAGDGRITRTVPRDSLGLAQTPQGIRRNLLEDAFRRAAHGAGATGFTDEAALLEAVGIPVYTVPGSPFNLKITTPDDLAWAEAWLEARTAGNA
jgi:2-C-methyl-D-erythritol 4-phosphate cytidylyltransferase